MALTLPDFSLFQFPGVTSSIAKAQAGLGYEPLHSFPQGIRRTVAWFLAHEVWWRLLGGK